MKEMIKEHGGMIAEAVGGLMLIGLLAGAFLGGGLSKIAKLFSAWLYG